eukprot:scaffold451_cov121-Cylindrotheca_fusiformis.AAC.12
MESMSRVCNGFSTVGNCIDHLETVKESLLLQKKNRSDNDTVATEATDMSDGDKEMMLDGDKQNAATRIQSYARGMIVRNQRKEEQAKAQRARIEKNLETVRAILRSTREAWSRCKGHICGGGGQPKTVFTRAAYFSILVTTKNKTVKFTTRSERIYKSFDTEPLVTLPPKLIGVFELQYGKHGFVNYAAFLETSMLFDDVILEPFLQIFKTHMESVQKCIAEIDGWIQESKTSLRLLEDIFELDSPLEYPEDWRETSAELGSARMAECLKEYHLGSDAEVMAAFEIGESQHQRDLRRLLDFLNRCEMR